MCIYNLREFLSEHLQVFHHLFFGDLPKKKKYYQLREPPGVEPGRLATFFATSKLGWSASLMVERSSRPRSVCPFQSRILMGYEWNPMVL